MTFSAAAAAPARCDRAMAEAVTRILCDTRPSRRADAVYLFAQTADNERSVFETARRIMAESLAARCLIAAAPPWEGYRGADAWEEALVGAGLEPAAIERVPLDAASHNTLTEAQALARFLARRGHSVVIVTAAPFHQVRAFMTAVGCVRQSAPGVRLYSRPGAALDWTAVVRHSQGRLESSRSGLIHAEAERISRYNRQGDLISYADVVDYLDHREPSAASAG